MLTYAERQVIEKYHKKGFSCGYIARVINRSKNAVVVEIKRGGQSNYTAKEGQRICDENKQKRYDCLSKINAGHMGKKLVVNIVERLSNLEMQIEILHDAFKGILSNGYNKNN